jgi:hypothetical protein
MIIGEQGRVSEADLRKCIGLGGRGGAKHYVYIDEYGNIGQDEEAMDALKNLPRVTSCYAVQFPLNLKGMSMS